MHCWNLLFFSNITPCTNITLNLKKKKKNSKALRKKLKDITRFISFTWIIISFQILWSQKFVVEVIIKKRLHILVTNTELVWPQRGYNVYNITPNKSNRSELNGVQRAKRRISRHEWDRCEGWASLSLMKHLCSSFMQQAVYFYGNSTPSN